MTFFGGVLGLELAHRVRERQVAFYWIGGRGQAPVRLRAAGVIPRDFSGNPADEPVVLARMPAASLYFHDPDGNLLEFLSMLPDAPDADLGVVPWSRWARWK
jgi:lactoylglutathione lyase